MPDNMFSSKETANLFEVEDSDDENENENGVIELEEEENEALVATKNILRSTNLPKVLLSGTADHVLLNVVRKVKSLLSSIEDHDAKLEDNMDEHLNEEEERIAEEEYQKEIAPRLPPMPSTTTLPTNTTAPQTTNTAMKQNSSIPQNLRPGQTYSYHPQSILQNIHQHPNINVNRPDSDEEFRKKTMETFQQQLLTSRRQELTKQIPTNKNL